MVSLIWLEGASLDGSELLLLQALDLLGENNLWWLGGINAGGLDGNDEMPSVLDELSGIKSKDTSLIWLGDISEDHINHWHEHPVLLRMSSILDDWDDVGSLFGHVDEVSTGSLGELNSVDATSWSNKVGNVRHSSSRGTTKVENLRAWFHVDVANTSDDG